MPTSLTIVCAVDFSDHSKAALRPALAWAGQFSARLIVATVVEPLLASAAAAAYNMNLARDEVLPELREFVRKLGTERGSGVPPYEAVVLTGNPATEIVALAQRERAGLLVIATHGLSGYRKMFLGSTTETVLRHTEVPVLVAPPPEQTPTRQAPPGQDPILVPVDFKSGSVGAVRAAAGVARVFRAPLLLAHVVAPLRGIDRFRAQLDTHNRVQIDRAEQQMQQLVSEAGVKERIEKVVVSGSPAEEISEIAVARGAQLIVMRLRGEGGVLGSRPGSIAYHVLRLTPAMVLALPSDHTHAEWLERL
ncbi:MAG: universal stress protein [Acidobacteria bacterium]|nr:MAG: universal stress protein [Acidobacteriota bacterium]